MQTIAPEKNQPQETPAPTRSSSSHGHAPKHGQKFTTKKRLRVLRMPSSLSTTRDKRAECKGGWKFAPNGFYHF